MVRVVTSVQLGMLLKNRVVARLQRLPDFVAATRDLIPSAYVAGATVVGTPMRNGFFDGGTNRVEVIGQIPCVEVGLYGHHAATDVYTDSGRNNGALRWDHAPNRGTNTPVHIRHRGNPFENEGELRHVQELLACLIFELHALR